MGRLITSVPRDHLVTGKRLVWAWGAAVLCVLPVRALAQVSWETPPSFGRKLTHEFLLPVTSVLLPGFGQFINGAPDAGFAFLGASVVGVGIAASYSDGSDLPSDRLPRQKDDQFEALGLHLAGSSALLSAYDSFRRSLPKISGGGRYAFLDNPTPTRRTFVGPFRFDFLKNKRTWIFLTIPVAILTAVAIDESGQDTDYLPFRGHDAFYAAGLSYGAGVTEEALFRGYLYPWFHQMSGRRFWVSNSAQALLFGLAHLSTVDVPVVQTLGGFYWGWVVRKDGWSIEETIFQHFWWDMILFTGALLLDDGGDTRFALQLPTIRF